ncbi:MAG: ABC transporter permease, partial [Gammaproteobacteria bacterium]
VGVIASLKPGMTLEHARADMTGVAAQLEKKYPDDNLGRGVNLMSLREQTVGTIRRALLILFGAVLVVLLIACVNIANLQLARAMERAKEVAIRSALGAGRLRLVRQFLTEGLLLTLVAGVLGLVLAFWGVDILVALAPQNIPRVESVKIDFRVLAFTSLISIVTGVAFGLVPALDSSRRDLQNSLKEGGHVAGSVPRRQRLRDLLAVSEVALSAVLVIAAALLIKSFWLLQQVDPGFKPDNVIKVELQLPASKYRQVFGEFPRWPQVSQFYRELLERARSLPGVESAALAHNHPLDPGWTTRFRIEGRPAVAPGQQDEVRIRPVSPDYFKTVGIPLLRGRLLTEQDHIDAPAVVVINESMARRYFPDENPVGKKVGYFRVTCDIVGIVGNERFGGLGLDVPPAIYPALQQTPFGSVSLLVRSPVEPAQIAPALRREVLALDRDLPIFRIALLENLLSSSIAQPRFNMLLLGLFAGVALVLALVGVYGLLNYSVSQRTHEIGVRMALGAQSGDVLRLIAGRGMALMAIGVALGLAGAAVLTRLMSTLLFGVTATDPFTFAGVAIALGVVGLCASYIPARRATKVDPLIALRYE